MSNSWMVEALMHVGYTVRFKRGLGDWKITVFRDRQVVYETHGHTEAQVIRRAYFKLIDPEPERAVWHDPEVKARVEAACRDASVIVARLREAGVL